LAVEPEQDASATIVAITACGGRTSLHNNTLRHLHHVDKLQEIKRALLLLN